MGSDTTVGHQKAHGLSFGLTTKNTSDLNNIFIYNLITILTH